MIGKRLARIVLALISLAIVAPLAMCVVLPIGLNEFRAMRLAQQYLQVPHPPNTERIATRYGSDKLSNSDTCDFTYLEARSYRPEDRQKIEAFYAQLPSLDPILKGPRFEEWNGGVLADISGVYRDFTSDLANTVSGTYYLLEAEETYPNEPPLLDWRCI